MSNLGKGCRGVLDSWSRAIRRHWAVLRSHPADGFITPPLGKERPPFSSAEKLEAIEQLMRIHYNVFMSNPRFWYDKELQAADTLVCVAASDLRGRLQ